jgi:PAS domain S-box-containing protein
MPLRLLTRTQRWKKGDLATRISLLTSTLALLLLLPVLGLSYTALRSLITDKAVSELEVAAIESRLRFEARLDALVELVRNTAAQSIYSNALADSGERNAYIKPLLREICSATPEIEALVLTDFEGKPLAQGCRRHEDSDRWISADMNAAIAQGEIRLGVVEVGSEAGSASHLNIAAPIVYLPTSSLEGGLWAQINLARLFSKISAEGHSPTHRLQLRPAGAGLPTAGTLHSGDGELRYHVPVSLRAGGALPLAIEVAVARDVAHRPLELLILACVLFGLAIILLTTWQSRRIASDIAAPLAELELTARRVAAGDLDNLPSARLDPTEQDSFRVLASSVYRMIGILRDTQQQLSSTLATRTREMERAEADRRLKEHALASSNSGVLIVEHTQDGGRRVRYVNAAFLGMSGLAETAVIGAPWPDLLPDQERAACPTDAPPDCGNAGAPHRRVWTRADGSVRHLEFSASPVIDEDGQDVRHSIIIASDVTAHHQAELAIAVRERAMQAAPNGFIITDLMRPDNPIVYVNPAFERITQYTAEEVIGHNCRLLRTGESDDPAFAQLREAIKARKSCDVVLRNRRKDGSQFWNQLSLSPVTNPATGEVTHYVGVQTDITERKASEDMMIEWLSRLDVIFTLSPDPLVCFDENGRLSYANAAAERVFGTTMGAMMSLTGEAFEAQLHAKCDPAYPYPGLPHTPSGLRAARMSGESVGDDQEAGEDDPTQDCLVYLLYPKPLTLHQTYRYYGAAGTSLVLYFRDVTREAELDRMKSEFLSTAAHELRTPMASILGFSELLMLRRYDENKTRDLLSTINRQAQRLTALLTDLLDLARIEARRAEGLRFETVPLRTAIDDTLSAFLLPDTRHRLVLDLPDTLPDIRADRAKFQQAMFNLLSNAIKFSPAGGSIEVSGRVRHPEGKPLFGIAIRDHGIGMTEEARLHAFDRFYRSDRSGHIPGTGLGLSLVKEIMKIHGGSVTLESEPDVGTCITLWFPPAQPESATAAPPTASEAFHP